MSTKNNTSTGTEDLQQGPDGATSTGTPSGTPEGQQEAAQQAQQEPTAPADGPQATDDPENDGSKAGNEAARRRHQLRAVEAERDTLAGTVDTLTGTVDSLQRQLVAQNMPNLNRLSADALWAAGHQAAEFFNEQGGIDSDKLTAATKAVHEKFGIRWGGDPVPGSGGGQGFTSQSSGPSWSDALTKKH